MTTETFATAKIEKWPRIWVRFFTKFGFRPGFGVKNITKSGPGSGVTFQFRK